MKKALITGITGQDGSYLAELLLDKGYEVYGLARRASVSRHERIASFLDKINIVPGDLTDQSSLDEAIRDIKPDEVYNLASQSFVPVSWNQPTLTSDVTGLGASRMLQAVRKNKPDAKFYQASSSEMFGKVKETPQNENTAFHPRSPYGVAKVFAHHLTVNCRESYGMFACSGILFNHESSRRGMEFVTRKISNAVAKIKLGMQDKLILGNLDAKRDWGYAGDYVKAMWLMLQQDEPGDYVVASGKTHSVREFVEKAFNVLGIKIIWEGNGLKERGYIANTGKEVVEVSKEFFRPAEVDLLQGDYTKAKEVLGWNPTVDFDSLVKLMVDADYQRLTMSPKELMENRVPF